MLNALLSYLVYGPAAILCILPMWNQMKYGRFHTVLIFIVSALILITLASYVDVRYSLDSNMMTMPLLAFFFVIYDRVMNVHLSKSLAVFFSIVSLMALISNFAALFDASRNPTMGAGSYTKEYSLFQFALAVVVSIILSCPLRKFGGWLIDRLDLPTVWYMTIPFSVVLLAINILLRPIKYETYYVNNVGRAVFLILLALFTVWAMLHIIFYFIVSNILKASMMEERNRILEMQESQFLSQQRYMQTTAKARHDFRQNILAICGLFDKGDYKALGAYLHRYTETIPQNEVNQFCENAALNAVLNYYVHTAMQYHIGFFLNIDLPKELPISDVDLCIIVGNILENAVTACQKVQNGRIDLRIVTKFGTMLYIVLTNDFDGKVKMSNGHYLPLNRDGHGQGLASVTTIAERYGGTTQFSHKGNEFYTSVSLRIIPVSRTGTEGGNGEKEQNHD